MSDLSQSERAEDLQPVLLCGLCRSGASGECHAPGCALYLNRAPDLPVATAQMIGRAVDGAEVQRRRLAAGYSRERLGAAAGGVSSATVKRIERGLVRPHPATVAALASALGCRPADLECFGHGDEAR